MSQNHHRRKNPLKTVSFLQELTKQPSSSIMPKKQNKKASASLKHFKDTVAHKGENTTQMRMLPAASFNKRLAKISNCYGISTFCGSQKRKQCLSLDFLVSGTCLKI